MNLPLFAKLLDLDFWRMQAFTHLVLLLLQFKAMAACCLSRAGVASIVNLILRSGRLHCLGRVCYVVCSKYPYICVADWIPVHLLCPLRSGPPLHHISCGKHPTHFPRLTLIFIWRRRKQKSAESRIHILCWGRGAVCSTGNNYSIPVKISSSFSQLRTCSFSFGRFE